MLRSGLDSKRPENPPAHAVPNPQTAVPRVTPEAPIWPFLGATERGDHQSSLVLPLVLPSPAALMARVHSVRFSPSEPSPPYVWRPEPHGWPPNFGLPVHLSFWISRRPHI